VFFESAVGLTPQALNYAAVAPPISIGYQYAQNVYEWEQAGVGSCPAASSAGCVYLISDGRDTSSNVVLLGTGATGNDVLFETADSLVPQDTDTEPDFYDARVGGGFPYTPPTQCTASTCQGPPSPAPALPSVATVAFTGPGSMASPEAAARKVTVRRSVVHGARFALTVTVPGAGRVTVSGAGIRSVTRTVGHAGSYRLLVSLSVGARRSMAREHRLRLGLRVAYTPATGRPSSAGVSVTVMPAVSSAHGGRRAATRSRGGAR
jgi:hypothetical protein